MSIFKKISLSLFFIFTCVQLSAQEINWQVGIELQAYPAGVIPGLRIEKALNERNALHLRVGYNIARHRDLGVHDNEEGGGVGFTLGYRHYFKADLRGLFLGIRNDVWFNTIDWQDDIDTPIETSGTTELIVLQPTVEGGYNFVFGDNGWAFAPTLGWGWEWNAKEDGAEVGEGAIILGGLNLVKRF